jgi:exopolyphosphatase/guanosine-5'-triphosphate,3'-diphosphate pyrophosphatase
MPRYAVIDVGTNTVLLLVAERTPSGFAAIAELGAITRLGKGVDASHRLAANATERTLDAIGRFAEEARRLGATALVVSATSAARDAENGVEFLAAAQVRADAKVEILSGEEEAQLSYLAVSNDFAAEAGARELVALDIGGGSTEFIFGRGPKVRFHTSINVGSVRRSFGPALAGGLWPASCHTRNGARPHPGAGSGRTSGRRGRDRHNAVRRGERHRAL